MSQKVRTRTRNDPEVRREQILDEAIRIIGQRGYYGFTVQELAQRCGLTNGGLLYHFGSKEQLLIAVLEERNRRNAEIVTSKVPRTALKAANRGSSLAAVRDVVNCTSRVCCASRQARLAGARDLHRARRTATRG